MISCGSSLRCLRALHGLFVPHDSRALEIFCENRFPNQVDGEKKPIDDAEEIKGHLVKCLEHERQTQSEDEARDQNRDG